MSKSITIVIPTRNRDIFLDECIKNLLLQDYRPFEIIVIDSSTDTRTKDLITQKYKNNTNYHYLENGANMRHKSKNIGISKAKGEIIAFIDDDGLVRQGWLRACVESYKSDEVGGVGGLIIDKNVENAEDYNTEAIGKVTFDGTRIGNFHKNPGRIIEVDHLRGCNMSFRKSVLDQIGGFDLNYTGSNVLEETDLCIRIKKHGYKILFNPQMAVVHTTAPRDTVLRKTFDYRRQYYIARNSTYFMIVNFGFLRTLAYFFTNDTGIPAFLRRLRAKPFFCIFVLLYGKIVGLFVGSKKKIINQ